MTVKTAGGRNFDNSVSRCLEYFVVVGSKKNNSLEIDQTIVYMFTAVMLSRSR